MPAPTFDHEKLHVYQRAIQFVSWSGELLQGIPKNLAAYSQLDRASTSIPLNIAEGTGKTTPPDRCRFFDTARGSAVECAACLDILSVRKFVPAEAILPGKDMLLEIVRMLVGLIRTNEPGRIREDAAEYFVGEE